ncbi:hypothetical protein BH10PLA1_BH10PLA1_01580 [soil metagenome]
MRHTAITCLIAFLLMSARLTYAEEPPTIKGPIDDAASGFKVFQVDSAYLGKTSTVQVLLPDKLEPGQTYRTLYVLPVNGGIGGEFGDPLVEVRKAGIHNRYKVICVTMSFDTVPWYGANATDPKIRHDLFLKNVVVPLVEKNFPVTGHAADRLLIGFSKSGWGAVSLLLRDPDFFGAACAWDAPLMMTEQDLKWGSRKHFGTPAAAAPYVPATLVKQKAADFAKGPPRLTILGHNLYEHDTRAFHELLQAQGIPHRYDNDLPAKHRWDSGWLPKAVEIMLGEPPRRAG